MGRSDRRPILPLLLTVVALAFVLRLGTALLWAPPVEADAADYLGLATRMAAGEGYVNVEGEPTSWRPPGYPAFLALLVSLPGPGGESGAGRVRVAQAVVGSAAVALAAGVGVAAGGPLVGILAAALMAVDPAQVAGTSRLLSETLFAFLLLGGTFALLVTRMRMRAAAEGGDARLPGAPAPFHDPVISWAGFAGLLLGVATLTRGALLAYPLAAAALLLLDGSGASPGRETGGDGRGGRRAAVALLLAWVLVLLPWTVRNHRVHGAFVPVATQMGATFYASQNPLDGYVMGMLPDDEVTRTASAMPEPEASRHLLGEGVRSLTSDPGRIPRLELLKWLYFWVPLDWEVMPWDGALNPVYAFVLLWAVAALLLGVRPAWPVWLPVAYFAALALVFYGSPRFRMPVEPLLAVVAAGGIRALALRRGSGAAVRWTAASGAALVVAALLAEPLKGAARSLLVSVGLWG